MLQLYSYFRSSASYRVRIALNWKQLPHEYRAVHLVKDGGQQCSSDYERINPMRHVPALVHDDFVLAESLPIIEYLEERFPAHPLLPSSPQDKAVVRQICEFINSGIQPLQNLKVTQYLGTSMGQTPEQVKAWTTHWISKGYASLETLLAKTAGTYCFGGTFTAADCFLIPQCFSSRRFGVRPEDYPNIARIEQNGLKLEAVKKAHPEKQPDYQA
ncbi:MAG: maleylacetoacetate isomerase [Bdellovibrionales bacterium]